ncbi:metallophosphoesterase family protein [uncultured Sphingomonas sp.]|uniref:metallophosphoesterase family protein n=1 Tax=uncultured Sphingomonas sp. TaxID=158754 RepID=UPI0025F09030|nr:metallophosphoesterase family protein [uncultured Sphingomonas sp.]
MALFGLGKKASVPDQPTSRVPDGIRVYAVGDVHGRFDLLRSLLARIEADDAARAPASTHVVLLGDLIDRGPQSREVVDLLLNHPPQFATIHIIMGNHEEMLLRLADDPHARGMAHFLRFGGRETFESYDAPQRVLDLPEGLPNTILTGSIPPEHLDFLRRAHHGLQFGDYLFVHAGIRPGIPLDKQSKNDLRWIRSDFLDSTEDHGVVVVHGHTIVPAPEVRANRIGIDTGAYASGVLTALGLEGATRWWLATERDR